MVEVGGRHVGIHLFPDLNKNGIRLETRDTQKCHEKTRFIAADSVAIIKGYVDIVGGVAGRLVFHRETHITDLLRDKVVYFAHISPKFLHLIRHCGSGFREVRLAEVPVPLREFRPRRKRGGTDALHLGVERRHIGFGEDLRRVRSHPCVED